MKTEKETRWTENEWAQLKADWKAIVNYMLGLRYKGKYGIDRGYK